MDILNNSANTANVFDLKQLNDIRSLSNKAGEAEQKDALKQAAKQFEAIFMQMLMKSMRQAEDVLAAESPFNTQTTKFFRDMHDQQLSMELSSNGSLGLATLIERQLGGADENYTPASLLNITHGNNLPINAMRSKASADTEANFVERKPTKPQQNTFADAESFVNSLVPYVDKAAATLGVPVPVLIAQSALETGWGKKIIQTEQGGSSNNLFNIKADKRWHGDSAAQNTLEFEQGTMIKKQQNFRVYDSIADSVADYTKFLTENPRYQAALNQAGNVEQFLQGLQKAGYATDPNYANKISSIVGTVTKLINR